MLWPAISSRLISRPSAVVLHRRHLSTHPFGSSKQTLSTIATPCVISTGSDHDLFAYTAGRYIFNEKRRFAERYAKFDVEALKTVAASSVGRDAVVQIKKLAEGGFNRVFVLTMSDGFEVIAKIPYPVTVPKKLASESEVATLDFLRTRGIPVPQVYAYSSESKNAVGTEYIIMEKAPGQPLDRRWFDLTPKERVRLVTSYVDIERKLFSIPFGSYGSLYYTHSVHPHLQHDIYRTPHKDDNQGRFCIGPSAGYTFWRGKRASLDLERGPWRDHREYVRSVGCREFEWTRRYGKPQRNDFPHNNIVKGAISPGIYLDLLQKFISLAPYILPEDRESPMNMPTMRHPDLNPSNVFVSDSCEVSCIVDWQHSSILPLLLTAGNPPLFENPDSDPPTSLEKPSLPDDYSSLGPEERSKAEGLHRRRMLFYLYMVFNGWDNKVHLEALRYPLLPLRQHAVDRAGRQWSGNIITLKGALIRLTERWEQLKSNPEKNACPVVFDKEESEEFYRVEEDWFKATILLEHWRSLLDDLGEDGWVRHEAYEAVMEMNKELKAGWLAEAEDEDDFKSVDLFWPFQDHEEID